MGEKELLRYIQSISHRTGFTATGDDAAVLLPTLGNLIVSTDQFIENTHFNWQQMSPEEIGHKAVVQALSDLAAMAAEPTAVLCSCAWPQEAGDNVLRAFRGIQDACLEYRVPLVGGDVSRSQAPQSYFDFTVIGQSLHPILKAGAKLGDLVAVSGPLGSASGGLRCLQENLISTETDKLINAFKKPRARIELALKLSALDLATSLTDISDSLSSSISQLSEHSRLGFAIELEKLPRDLQLETLCNDRQWPLIDFLLGGGEDYELLVTIKKNTLPSVLLDHGLTVIGRVVEGVNTYSKDNIICPLPEVGWDPFTL